MIRKMTRRTRPEVPGWPTAFRGSWAIRAGLLTRGALRGPRFRRVLPDVYVRTSDPPSLEMNIRARTT
jgi:hypothetical protein